MVPPHAHFVSAVVAELVYARDLKSLARKGLWVQIPPTAPHTARNRSHFPTFQSRERRFAMNGIIYLVGLIVVILAVLSFFGLR